LNGRDPEAFARHCLRPRRPAILTGAIDDWPALTPEWLAERSGDVRTHAVVDLPAEGNVYERASADHRVESSVAEFVEQLRSPSRTCPCYMVQKPLAAFTGLAAALDLGALSALSGHARWQPHVWLGSEGTRSGLHFDAPHNFLAQVYGRKRVILVAPDRPQLVSPFEWNYSKSQVDPERPALRRFPRFASAVLWEAVLAPGEVLFIPQIWWHHLTSLDVSISVNLWFQPAPIHQVLPVILQSGWRPTLAVLRQLVWNGLLRQPHEERLFGGTLPGVALLGGARPRSRRSAS